MGTYIVEFDYIAKSSDELTIRKGDIITDAIPAEQGWLKGECRGTFGYVDNHSNVFNLNLSFRFSHFPENFVTVSRDFFMKSIESFSMFFVNSH